MIATPPEMQSRQLSYKKRREEKRASVGVAVAVLAIYIINMLRQAAACESNRTRRDEKKKIRARNNFQPIIFAPITVAGLG